MFNGFNRPRTDNYFCPMRKNRLHKRGNVIGVVLVVCICIDNHIRAQTQTCLQAGHECTCQAFVAQMTNDMINTIGFCHLDRIVLAAIINNQPFDAIKARNRTRQSSQSYRQCFSLVVAGYLYDQFHLTDTKT